MLDDVCLSCICIELLYYLLKLISMFIFPEKMSNISYIVFSESYFVSYMGKLYYIVFTLFEYPNCLFPRDMSNLLPCNFEA